MKKKAVKKKNPAIDLAFKTLIEKETGSIGKFIERRLKVLAKKAVIQYKRAMKK